MFSDEEFNNYGRSDKSEPLNSEPTHAECVRAFELYSRSLSNWTVPGSQPGAEALLMGETPDDLPFYFNMDHA